VPEVYTIVASVSAVTAARLRPTSPASTPCPARASASSPPASSRHIASTFAGWVRWMASASRAVPANTATAPESRSSHSICSTEEVS
jgi:hypothetical protein